MPVSPVNDVEPARRGLLKTLAPHIAPQATVTCDEHPRYRKALEVALSAQ